MPQSNTGYPYKKGQLLKIVGLEDVPDGIYEVKDDVEWNKDFNCWGSVWLVNFYPPLFTHKGLFEIVGNS